ncbi:MAG TPA: hypothetical protein VN132_14470 [Bdellovibrio sp.]|nr:hypothetical protein [Bdellovibrio sp.]
MKTLTLIFGALLVTLSAHADGSKLKCVKGDSYFAKHEGWVLDTEGGQVWSYKDGDLNNSAEKGLPFKLSCTRAENALSCTAEGFKLTIPDVTKISDETEMGPAEILGGMMGVSPPRAKVLKGTVAVKGIIFTSTSTVTCVKENYL